MPGKRLVVLEGAVCTLSGGDDKILFERVIMKSFSLPGISLLLLGSVSAPSIAIAQDAAGSDQDPDANVIIVTGTGTAVRESDANLTKPCWS